MKELLMAIILIPGIIAVLVPLTAAGMLGKNTSRKNIKIVVDK
jgi:hypothetical protein